MTKKTLYTICRKSGAVITDLCGNAEVFYLATDPKALVTHLDQDEIIKHVSPSILKRTWVLKNGRKPLSVKRGVYLAAKTKALAQQVADVITLNVTPMRLVG